MKCLVYILLLAMGILYASPASLVTLTTVGATATTTINCTQTTPPVKVQIVQVAATTTVPCTLKTMAPNTIPCNPTVPKVIRIVESKTIWTTIIHRILQSRSITKTTERIRVLKTIVRIFESTSLETREQLWLISTSHTWYKEIGRFSKTPASISTTIMTGKMNTLNTAKSKIASPKKNPKDTPIDTTTAYRCYERNGGRRLLKISRILGPFLAPIVEEALQSSLDWFLHSHCDHRWLMQGNLRGKDCSYCCHPSPQGLFDSRCGCNLKGTIRKFHQYKRSGRDFFSETNVIGVLPVLRALVAPSESSATHRRIRLQNILYTFYRDIYLGPPPAGMTQDQKRQLLKPPQLVAYLQDQQQSAVSSTRPPDFKIQLHDQRHAIRNLQRAKLIDHREYQLLCQLQKAQNRFQACCSQDILANTINLFGRMLPSINQSRIAKARRAGKRDESCSSKSKGTNINGQMPNQK